MDCPICKTVKLAVTERQGIEIDYCPQCRGVWLDRGELDKIIDRSASHAPAAQSQHHAPASASYPSYPAQPDRSHAHRDAYHGGHGHPRKKKREGFLSDLFDFD